MERASPFKIQNSKFKIQSTFQIKTSMISKFRYFAPPKFSKIGVVDPFR